MKVFAVTTLHKCKGYAEVHHSLTVLSAASEETAKDKAWASVRKEHPHLGELLNVQALEIPLTHHYSIT